MSFSRRSSFPGIGRLPSFLSPSPPTVPESELERPKSSPPQSIHEICTDIFDRPSASGATSPSSTIRPRHRRFSSSMTIKGASEPIPISPPTSPLHGPSYLAQRQANLNWAIRHNDTELIRTERAAIERYKQELADSYGLSLEGGGSTGTSSGGTGSIESFDIPIRDTSQTSCGGGVRYSTGRRMSCLANYEGLPVTTAGESSDYFVALGGGGEGEERKARSRYSPVATGPSSPSASSSTRRSPVRTSGRRASSPYRPSGIVVPFSPLLDSQPSSTLDNPQSASNSIPSSCFILPDPSTTSESEGNEGNAAIESPVPFRPLSTDLSSTFTPPTRIIHGFHVDSSSSSSTSSDSPSPSASSQAQSIRPPTPPSAHSICRGRAGSVSFIGGLGCGNVQQERMELQASRDIEVLDREAMRREKRGVSRDSRDGVARVRGGRTKDGKVAAAERLRKGYSGEYQLTK
ncbi:hypothetical protein JCM3765_003193 [Sporobolomyces pararoseus]